MSSSKDLLNPELWEIERRFKRLEETETPSTSVYEAKKAEIMGDMCEIIRHLAKSKYVIGRGERYGPGHRGPFHAVIVELIEKDAGYDAYTSLFLDHHAATRDEKTDVRIRYYSAAERAVTKEYDVNGSSSIMKIFEFWRPESCAQSLFLSLQSLSRSEKFTADYLYHFSQVNIDYHNMVLSILEPELARKEPPGPKDKSISPYYEDWSEPALEKCRERISQYLEEGRKLKKLTITKSVFQELQGEYPNKSLPLLVNGFSAESCRLFLKTKKQLWDEHGFVPWAFLINGEFAGWGGLQPEHGEADFAQTLHPKFCGWGQKIFNKVKDQAFNQLGLNTITILLPPSRPISNAITRIGLLRTVN